MIKLIYISVSMITMACKKGNTVLVVMLSLSLSISG